MPDEKKPTGSITQAADAQKERVAGVSNVSKTVNAMAQNVKQDIRQTETKIKTSKEISSVQSAMNNVLRKMGETMETFATGMKNVTMSTAEATKSAINQYGKAIGEDIHWNKKNIIAMSLARATPLFGYFAAKFMETDVFQSAAQRMRENIGKAVGGAFRFLTGRKKVEEEEKIPKMQRGGLVKKGGLVEVHAGEIVAPIEKILDKVDEQISTVKDLAQISKKAQLRSLGLMKEFIGTVEEPGKKKGLVKGFVHALAEAERVEEMPIQERQLRALLAIQDAVGGQFDKWSQIWSKFLLEHPSIRTLLFTLNQLYRATAKPLIGITYGLFRARGGYQADLSRAENPMVATAENIGALYVGSMWRLDNIARFTRATAEATRDLSRFITGIKYPRMEGVDEGSWSIMGVLARGLGKLLRFGLRGIAAPIEFLVGKATGVGYGVGAVARGLVKERRIKRRMFGGGRRGKILEGVYGAEDWSETAGEAAEEGAGIAGAAGLSMLAAKYYVNMLRHIKWEQGRARIENKQFQIEDKNWRQQNKISKKQLNESEEQNTRLKRIRRGLTGGRIWSFLLMAGAFLKDMLMKTLGSLLKGGKWLSSALAGAVKSIPFLASGSAFASFLGPALGVAAAAAVGAGLGTLINKYLIAPWRDKMFALIDEAKRKGAEAEEKAISGTVAMARKRKAGEEIGAKEAMETGKQTRLTTMLRTDKEIEEARRVGIGGKAFGLFEIGRYDAVTGGQAEFIQKHYGEYMNYPLSEIRRLRVQFNEDPGLRPTTVKWWEDPFEYGQTREKKFLDYLKRKGTKGGMGPEEQMMFREAARMAPAGGVGHVAFSEGTAAEKILTKYGQTKVAAGAAIEKGKEKLIPVIDKATGRLMQIKESELRKMDRAALVVDRHIMEMMAQGLAFEDAVKRIYGDKADIAKRVEEGIGAVVQNITNITASQTQNMAASPTAQGLRGVAQTAHDYYSDKLTSGEYK